MRVRAELDSVSDEVPHVGVGRRVILLHAKSGGALCNFTLAHVHEDLQALFFGAVAPRRRRLVLARLRDFGASLEKDDKRFGVLKLGDERGT